MDDCWGEMRDRIPIAISVAALVVAILGWTPAGEAAKSFVTGKDIRDGTLTSSDVKNNSLTGKDVRDNTLTGKDVSGLRGLDMVKGAIRGREIATGAVNTSHLAKGAVSGAKIAKEAIGAEKIANAAIESRHIRDRSLNEDDLAIGEKDDVANFGTVADGARIDFTTPIDGAAEPNDLTVVVPFDTLPHGWVIMGLRVTNKGTARLRLCNFTGLAADPPSFTFHVLILDA